MTNYSNVFRGNYNEDLVNSLLEVKYGFNKKSLNSSDEKELGLKIQKALLAEEKLNNANGNKRNLIKIIEEGNNARDILVYKNLKFVTFIAKSYLNKGLSFDDLFQAGTAGLVIASNRFDVEANVKFCTYASHWIKNEIIQALSNNNPIVSSHKIAADIAKYKIALEALEERLNRKPTLDEIAERLGFSKDKVLYLKDLSLSTTSLDKEVGEEVYLSDFIASDEPNSVQKRLSKELLITLENAVSQVLDKRERDIVLMYNGFYGNCGESYRKIGEALGLSGEGVRKIYNNAISKIRHSAYYNDLCALRE